LHSRLKDSDAATPHLREALDLAAAPDGGTDRVEVLTAMGEWAIAADRPAEAAVFLAGATSARERIPGLVPFAWVRPRHERAIEHLQNTLSADDLEQLQHDGEVLTYDEVAQRAHDLLDEAPDERPVGTA
jgi:hypothetical protein